MEHNPARPPADVTVIESNALFRRYLAQAIDGRAGLRVACALPCRPDLDGMEALAAEVSRLRPRAVLLDLEPWRMEATASANPIEVVRRVAMRSLGSRIVAMSNGTRAGFIARVLTAGAAAHLLKDAMCDEELLGALSAAAEGATYVCRRSREALCAHALRAPALPRVAPFEARLLAAVASAPLGTQRKVISRRLGVTPATVCNCMLNLRSRFEVATDEELLARCREMGVV